MKQQIELFISGYFIIINLAGFIIMWIDKNRAIKKEWRIRERTMFLCGAFGGCIGIWSGMQCFRHKTKHAKFVYGIPGIFIVQCVAVVVIWFQLGL